MSTLRTAEEAKKHYIASMGDALGKQYHALWQELAWLHAKWEEYVELFGTKPSRLEILNSAAPRFFRTVQDCLWEDTLLHIARLTDRPKVAGRQNLTIQALPGLISDSRLSQQIQGRVTLAIEATTFCRDWRNRRIAHRDLHLAIEEGLLSLESASRLKVKGALQALTDVLNAISGHYLDSTSLFDVGDGADGALALLYVLHDGLRYDTLRRERLRRGEYDPEDMKPKGI